LLAAQAGLVGGGPFAGMRLLADAAWADGDLAPKLLGCYEAELHPAIERAAARNPQLIVNIGCAEGYYAVGMARLLPAARVHAFEIIDRGQELCRNASIENGVAERLSVAGKCDSQLLKDITAYTGHILLIVDCEGAELDLLDPGRVPALERCDMIVECHDFANSIITQTLRERFSPSHDVETVLEGPRDPNRFTQLRQLPSMDRWIAVNEGRPATMNWIICWARSTGNSLGTAKVNFGNGIARDVFFRLGTSDEDIIRFAMSNHFNLARLRRLQELRDFAGRLAAQGKRPLIVDAGANIGTASAWFACNFADAQVMAIEPDAGNFSLLTKNVVGLAVEPINSAVSANRGFARIVDPGEGHVGLRTKPVRGPAQGAVPRVTINDLYSRTADRCFPFIVKVDIEGGEVDLFSSNTDWLEQTPLLIVELHDWLLNRTANSRAFLRCVSRLDRDFVYFGEHIYSIANDLGG
jgi:FkbM family methyltransferase